MRKLPLVLAGLSTLALTAFALYPRAQARPQPAPAAPSALRCEGRVAAYPGADLVVSAEYGGRLASLPVRELDRVRAGQVLARLDSREQEASLASARARVRELEAEGRFLDLELRRQQRLLAAGVVGQRAFDDADSQLRLSRARREAALATAAQLEAALAKLTLVAPFSGVIVERLAQPGELLAPGGRLVRIADLDRLRVEAEVDEYDLPSLAVGREVAIEVEGTAGTLAGRVEEVPAAVSLRRLKPLDPARPSDIRVALVKVALPREARLKLGQRVELAIASGSGLK
ncbi:efflux RND transporter periplasmic adaptor subunit [Geothrix sp. 21YS21S-2]|uniref:efflux RND transporter periplasmic adaptor subunit n=1 Tax=Geothrix sp. 21YS21S-2 TaxID=3068893 RepID=UPI0027BAAC17|nr:efflux RND transporter periplasmic adaptor subunit [Geothrix sp. 21YS21S-2]